MEKVSFNVNENYDCDIAVIGGGVGGFAAAVSAARQGQSVILIENAVFWAEPQQRDLSDRL